MIACDLQWVAAQVGGELIGQNTTVRGVSTDTRTLQAGDLFVALVAERDGHEFLQTAKEAGASAALVSRRIALDIPQIVVEDTLLALGNLASAVRQRLPLKVVSVTGSAGKTTTKEMMAAILSQSAKVLATEGNFNNHIGVPLTLLRLHAGHEFAVVELGANHQGEIAYTAGLAKPNVAMITNVAPAHLEGFGSIEGVATAKQEIYEALDDNAIAVINADSEYASRWLKLNQHRKVISVTTRAEKAQYISGLVCCAEDIEYDSSGCIQFSLCLINSESQQFEKARVQLHVAGDHQLSNALMAAAGTYALGASVADIQAGLQSVQPVKGRGEVYSLGQNLHVIDDTYNASVNSVKAAIDLLALRSGKRVLVLGNMAELGAESDALHREVGDYAKTKGVDCLVGIGESAAIAATQVTPDYVFSSQEELFDALASSADADNAMLASIFNSNQETTILVKGSRSAKMENVVQYFIKFFQQAQEASC